MTLHEFVFTKKKPKKFLRHISFWIGQWLFWSMWATFFFNPERAIAYTFKNYPFFILEIQYTYLVAYYYFPRYFQKKEIGMLTISFLLLSFATYVVFVVYHLWVFDLLRSSRDEVMLMSWFFSVNFFINGPPVICAMFLTFKMLKNYYLSMEEKQVLIKENANAQLQLLKAQVHPHFLFNTLNNLYSFSLNGSSKTGELIKRLSHTLRYMIRDCESSRVPLNKELNMIKDYMELEKVRYGDRLIMKINIEGDINSQMIAPLLMIPLIENSFKHGASQLLQHPVIQLNIRVSENVLSFQLMNSRPVSNIIKKNGRIGLKNVKKRLQLIYPGKHQLEITESDDSFFVRMILELSETPSYA